jgi:hypothetical protein
VKSAEPLLLRALTACLEYAIEKCFSEEETGESTQSGEQASGYYPSPGMCTLTMIDQVPLSEGSSRRAPSWMN